MENTDKPIQLKHRTPFLIRVCATSILVMGFIGLGFFATIGIYEYLNPQSLYNNNYIDEQYKNLNLYILLLAILHIVMVISGLLIIKLKRMGIYFFLFVLISILGAGLLFENSLVKYNLIMGLILLILLAPYYRQFK